jgi:trigger factor
MTTIQIENLSDIKKKVTVEVPQEIVETTIAGRYKELGKKAQIKGFRKGKVPMNILKSYFHKDVEAEAIKEIVEQTFDSKLKEENIPIFSVIQIDPEDLALDKPFKYTAEIEVPPAVKVTDYKGLSLTKPSAKVEDSDVDSQIGTVREQHARLVSIAESATVAKSDHVVVDVTAQGDGQGIKELTVTDYHLELGRDFFVPDFDSRLEGMKVDETRSFSMDFAEDFPRKSLAGKTVSFQVTLKDAKHKVLPELDDDFAKDLGEFENLEQLRTSIRERLQRAEDDKAAEKTREQILDSLLAKNEFEVPDFMVEAQIDRFMNQTLGSLINYGLDPRTMPPQFRPNRELFREPAVRMVKAGLMLKSISEEEKLEVTEGDLQAAIEERAKESNFSADHLMDKLEKADALGEFRVSLLNDKVFDLIKSHATITEEEPAPPEESETETQAEERPKPTKKKRKEQ